MEKSQNTKVNISIMMVQFTWETLFKIKEREKEECFYSEGGVRGG